MDAIPIPTQAHGSRLVATCWSADFDELLARVRSASASLDAAVPPAASPGHLVEARLDLLRRPAEPGDLSLLAQAAPGRLLVTCRPGGSAAPEGRAERHALLRSALERGAVAVDLEADGGSLPPLPAGLLVLSHHEGPEDAELSAGRSDELVKALVAAARSVPPSGRATERSREIILKLAAPTASAAAALDLATAGHRIPAELGWAPVGMGPGGQWLRILARRAAAVLPSRTNGASSPRPWSALAYCAEGHSLPGVSLGQLSLDDMLATFRADRLTASTRLLGIAGWPLEATWSPALHSRLLGLRGIDAVLLPLPARDVAEMMRVASRLAIEGLAVTMPHKEAARSLAHVESDRVQRSGVVNTLRRRGDAWEGESFDGAAVAALLARHVDLGDAHVIVLGAGGAARTAGAELAAAGARVTFVARRPEQAEMAAAFVRSNSGGDGVIVSAARLDALPGLERDALVQATPMGSGSSTEWPEELVPFDAIDSAVVLDMVSVPARTELMRRVRAAGRIAIDGVAMLAHQAAAQQRWWCDEAAFSGDAPSADEVERVLRELVARHE